MKDNGSVGWQTDVFSPQSILGVDRDVGKHVGDRQEHHQLDLDQCVEQMRDGGDIQVFVGLYFVFVEWRPSGNIHYQVEEAMDPVNHQGDKRDDDSYQRQWRIILYQVGPPGVQYHWSGCQHQPHQHAQGRRGVTRREQQQ